MNKTDPTMQTQLGGDLDTLRQMYHPPSYGGALDSFTPHVGAATSATGRMSADNAGTLPQYYPRGITHMPVQYGGPSAEKENMDRLNKLIEVAPVGAGGAQRVAPIGDKEVNYLKYMEDMAELAKFDNYVESFVDPRQPGSAEFLFKVYPEYINRRMQQAHTDYEFALRNQMIDMWGINTFDDLYFKYLVDQKRIEGPQLSRANVKKVDDDYVAAYLAPWRYPRPGIGSNHLYLPFSSATMGNKPAAPDDWKVNRTGPFKIDQNREQMAHSIFTSSEGVDAAGRYR
jgi:hypothetical protein